MNSNLLHVVSVMCNPLRWESRVRLYKQFEQFMLKSGVNLTTVECAMGERPFELNTRGVNYVRVRHNSIVWNKENLTNLGFAEVLKQNPGAKYLAWVDGDVSFLDPNWASETVEYLQRYAILQPWSDAYDTGPLGIHQHINAHKSFCFAWLHGMLVDNRDYDIAHPGYAWAIRRREFEEVGRLIETAALGAGDRHMSLALIGEVLKQIAPGITDGYKRPLLQWQANAIQFINYNIGYVPGTLVHYWHGRKADRQYWDRWKILVRNKFDPTTDLKYNIYGVIELARNKPKLTRDIDLYFRTRAEDGNLI